MAMLYPKFHVVIHPVEESDGLCVQMMGYCHVLRYGLHSPTEHDI